MAIVESQAGKGCAIEVMISVGVRDGEIFL